MFLKLVRGMPASKFGALPDKKVSDLFADICTVKVWGAVVKDAEYEGTGQGRLKKMIEVSSAEEATKASTSVAEAPGGGLLDSEEEQQTPNKKGKKGK